MTEKPDLLNTPPTDMPQVTEAEAAHSEMMGDPAYAIATHTHQLNKFADLIEELCVRVISIEKKILDMEEAQMGVDPNDPINGYPEVQQHQNR
tara:strand:+ start:1129 stop:1407 length:279 start_codon:yes stop_codon:yes gene_type:complete